MAAVAKSSKESTAAVLIAVALAEEDNYWLCEPIGAKPPTGEWKSVACRWLYPVESSLSRFVGLSGFATTDSVFTLGQEGVSRVEHFASLAADVRAKRQRIGREVFFFVPQDEIRRLDELYKQLLRREAQLSQQEEQRQTNDKSGQPGVSHIHDRATHGARGGDVAAARQHKPAHHTEDKLPDDTTYKARSHRPPPLHERQSSVDGGESGEKGNGNDSGGEEEDSMSQATTTNASSSVPMFYRGSVGRSHKRKTPHVGTTTHIAPDSSRPFGTHASVEAFRWPRRFIAHRGSVDYLCPAPADNTYGFRLDKVIHDGFPVFLLFGSQTCNSHRLDPPATAVPVYQSALLEGEGGEGHIASKVLVVTRQSMTRLKHGRDEDDDDAHAMTAAPHAREVVAQIQPPMTAPYGAVAQTRPAAATASDARLRHGPRDGEPPVRRPRGRPPRRLQLLEAATRQPPTSLQAVSVNTWTDATHTVPPTAQLAQRFPLILDGDVPLRTAVLADGSCVTYTAASAVKAASLLPPTLGKRPGWKAGGGHQTNGTAAATAASAEDTDMRDLLSHIQLAKAQVSNTL